jgi:hypothetical protein
LLAAGGLYDTYAAVLWDDDNLYVGFWVEEPLVVATLTERDSPIYEDNDVELFIAGRDAYYEFEITRLEPSMRFSSYGKMLTRNPRTVVFQSLEETFPV